jgi:hypothetical protein
VSKQTCFKSRAGIRKYLINHFGFDKNSIDVSGEGYSTYLYLAKGDTLYKCRLCGQPTYTTHEYIDQQMKELLNANIPAIP